MKACFRVSVLIVFLGIYLHAKTGFAQEEGWESLIKRIDPDQQAIAGQWMVSKDELTVHAAEGARLLLPFEVKAEYDLRIRFTRRTGQHSIGLIVVHGGRRTAFEVDAWGQHLAGFQNLSGRSMTENRSRRNDVRLQNNRQYTLTVEVRRNGLRGLLDQNEISRIETDGSDLSVPDLWKLPDGQTCALLAWDSETVFHAVEYRRHREQTAPTLPAGRPGLANTGAGKAATGKAEMRNAPRAAADGFTEKGVSDAANGSRKPHRSRRVLIVIANHHFFYREYADPRAELERAGIQVTVAAGRKSPCRPHSGSGEGPDGGIVNPDLALSEVKAADYDAVLFSGGWGASMYQYAFNGRYNEPAYNGSRDIRAQANRIVNEFLADQKQVCALCNATSVLAWARVDGRSPLEGPVVCAPTREAPPGVYNGRAGQPSCRWHAEVNGARMSPPGSIGQPGTAADDVVQDGLILTGEDDISAREMGRKIVQILNAGR